MFCPSHPSRFAHRNVIWCAVTSGYIPCLDLMVGHDSSVGIALGYGLDDGGNDSQWGLGIFLFTTASRTALGSIQPHTQCVTGALSLGIKRPEREANYSLPSSAEVKE
jgi:hypothetical protein